MVRDCRISQSFSHRGTLFLERLRSLFQSALQQVGVHIREQVGRDGINVHFHNLQDTRVAVSGYCTYGDKRQNTPSLTSISHTLPMLV